MLDGRLAQIYVALWGLGHSLTPRSSCHYMAPHTMIRWRSEHGPVCVFLLDPPRIWLQRDPVPSCSTRADLASATLSELISLAHERGHERSWREDMYVDTSTTNDSELVLAEERRAWGFGADAFRDRGFEEWEAFEDRRARAVQSYVDRFSPRR